MLSACCREMRGRHEVYCVSSVSYRIGKVWVGYIRIITRNMCCMLVCPAISLLQSPSSPDTPSVYAKLEAR